jgi:outer membrane protein OmpA-like peptidoglycan-associated protein
VGRPCQLSFNTPTTNPQFEGVYRSLTPVPGTAPGYVEDFPFVGDNRSGRGEVTLGLKFGLLSERKGKPVSFSARTDFVIPTQTTLRGAKQTGLSNQFNLNIGLALSKTFWDPVIVALNWNYRFTRDPRFDGVRAMRQPDQIRTGAGFLIFPEKRLQLLNEYTGLIFVGNHTPDTSFGARDPFEVLVGLRVYAWRDVALDVGYRRAANLQGSRDPNGFLVKLGTVSWRGKRPPANRPPVAACSADKTLVFAGSGDVVNVTVQASDPDGDPLTYSWSATGGRLEGSGPQVKWNSAGVAPGLYTVRVRVDDGRGGTAECAVEIRVEPRPNRPPTLSCSVDRSTVIAGERVRIHGEGYDPDGDPLTYTWRTTGGQILGSGPTVQLDTSGLAPGRYTVSGRVDDGRGGAADCAVEVNIQAPPPQPQSSKLNECLFRPSSARVDNVCKRILDDVALRLQNEPKARVVILGYADPKERRHSKLASERAEAARNYLGEKGIAASRIDTRAATRQAGAGKENRRIDIIWVPEGASY